MRKGGASAPTLVKALGEPRYRAEWAAGTALSRDALLAEAMERADGGRGPALTAAPDG